MALYRGGRYEDAVTALQAVAAWQADHFDLGQTATNAAFLVMAQSKLGHGQEAHAALTDLRDKAASRNYEDNRVWPTVRDALVREANSVFDAAFPAVDETHDR